jgi:hypothetical protein
MDHWGRRQFVQGVGVAGLGLLAGCGRLPGRAQQPARIARVGYLGIFANLPGPSSEAFMQGLPDLH